MFKWSRRETRDPLLALLSMRHAVVFPVKNAGGSSYAVDYDDDATIRQCQATMPIAARVLGFCASDHPPWLYHDLATNKRRTPISPIMTGDVPRWQSRLWEMLYMHTVRTTKEDRENNVLPPMLWKSVYRHSMHPLYTDTIKYYYGSSAAGARFKKLTDRNAFQVYTDLGDVGDPDPDADYDAVFKTSINHMPHVFAFLLDKKYTSITQTNDYPSIMVMHHTRATNMSVLMPKGKKRHPKCIILYNDDYDGNSYWVSMIVQDNDARSDGSSTTYSVVHFTMVGHQLVEERKNIINAAFNAIPNKPNGARIDSEIKIDVPFPDAVLQDYDVGSILDRCIDKNDFAANYPDTTLNAFREMVKMYAKRLKQRQHHFERAMLLCAMLRFADRTAISRDNNDGWAHHGGVAMSHHATGHPTTLHVAQAVCSAADTLAAGIDVEVPSFVIQAKGRSVDNVLALPERENIKRTVTRSRRNVMNDKAVLRLGRRHIEVAGNIESMAIDSLHPLPHLDFVFHMQMIGAHADRITSDNVVALHRSVFEGNNSQLNTLGKLFRHMMTKAQSLPLNASQSERTQYSAFVDRPANRARPHLAAQYRAMITMAATLVDGVTMANTPPNELLRRIYQLILIPEGWDNGNTKDQYRREVEEALRFWTSMATNIVPNPNVRNADLILPAVNIQYVDPKYKAPRIHPYLVRKLFMERDFNNIDTEEYVSQTKESTWSVLADIYDATSLSPSHVGYPDIKGHAVLSEALRGMPRFAPPEEIGDTGEYGRKDSPYNEFVSLAWRTATNADNSSETYMPKDEKMRQYIEAIKQFRTFQNETQTNSTLHVTNLNNHIKDPRNVIPLPMDSVLYLREVFTRLHSKIAQEQAAHPDFAGST